MEQMSGMMEQVTKIPEKFLGALPFLSVSAEAAGEGPFEPWGWHSWMWGAWGFGMMLLLLLFWGLVIVGLIVGIRWLIGQGQRSAPGVGEQETALEILKKRYARGEIDKEEYEARKRDLLE